jgi:cyclopropane fatty-acyl-phospholipid synthase-like methyltransferase
MFRDLSKTHALVWVVLGIAALAAGAIAWRFSFFYAPFAWTGEPARLAHVLGLQPGMQIADIGAGSGAHAVAMAAFVGDTGQVYATELNPERRADIEGRISRAAIRNVRVVAADETETRLPARGCDAIYMRAVFHHIPDHPAFAAQVAQALRPGGRLAVIDFAPGTLWFHGADHGVQPDVVQRAFESTGLRLRERIDDWGGGMFLLAFESPAR